MSIKALTLPAQPAAILQDVRVADIVRVSALVLLTVLVLIISPITGAATAPA